MGMLTGRVVKASRVVHSAMLETKKARIDWDTGFLFQIKESLQDYLIINGTSNSATMLTTLITGLSAGPAVSL